MLSTLPNGTQVGVQSPSALARLWRGDRGADLVRRRLARASPAQWSQHARRTRSASFADPHGATESTARIIAP